MLLVDGCEIADALDGRRRQASALPRAPARPRLRLGDRVRHRRAARPLPPRGALRRRVPPAGEPLERHRLAAARRAARLRRRRRLRGAARRGSPGSGRQARRRGRPRRARSSPSSSWPTARNGACSSRRRSGRCSSNAPRSPQPLDLKSRTGRVACGRIRIAAWPRSSTSQRSSTRNGWSPLRRELDVQAFGINAWTRRRRRTRSSASTTRRRAGTRSSTSSPPAARSSRSTARRLDARTGTVVFVRDPASKRTAVAAEAGTTVVSVGGKAGEAYEPLRLGGERAGLRALRARADRRGAKEMVTDGARSVRESRGAALQPRVRRGAAGRDRARARAPGARRSRCAPSLSELARDDERPRRAARRGPRSTSSVGTTAPRRGRSRRGCGAGAAGRGATASSSRSSRATWSSFLVCLRRANMGS